MTSFRHRARCGACSLAIAISWSGQALAQQAPTPPAEDGSLATESRTNDVPLDEIVVTGSRPIAESEAAALNVQRRADSIVAVAASDAVGRLPDQNVAQAASRLPGVAVERDQGQARYISLRGAPNCWTTLSFDGLNVVSSEGPAGRFRVAPGALGSTEETDGITFHAGAFGPTYPRGLLVVQDGVNPPNHRISSWSAGPTFSPPDVSWGDEGA
ncbi:TonB-dependent receptor plug domain-containing protein [Sphingomonas piscis]|uniref:TonB-dependent receptor plug domain-containing protein n=1 Tax=Sphingomonas piscis TaxID=2714943 RepID=A0A6G7YN54_9SPHN|nr:TonB-dependent receptor plug domain-containing protein [Sphingomonas piscis]QIK78175.1 TonB-dependent receptor plug domain-containing protein [Sphingomonas piscis]